MKKVELAVPEMVRTNKQTYLSPILLVFLELPMMISF